MTMMQPWGGSSATAAMTAEWNADWGDTKLMEDFRTRALARLVLLTEADPQFRRNRERINRDAERELISLEWDLGRPDPEFEE